MSLESGDFEMEFELSAEEIKQQHDIHEYAFGIISSDSKGLSSIVSIKEPYKKPSSGTSVDEEDLLNSVAFHEWTMSRYQSSSCLEEEVYPCDEFNEDANNNTTRRSSESREIRGYSLKTSSSSSCLRTRSAPKKIPTSSLRRRWSTSSIFGGKSASPPQVKLTPVEDPDMPATPPEKWFASFTQIPDKIRQHMADKNRFNIGSAPRDQLKQLYCY